MPTNPQPTEQKAVELEDWLRGDWYETWQDATENASDELMVTLEALRGRVDRTITAALATRPLDTRVSALHVGLKRLYHAYVQLLESGRDRIVDLGGDCDPVDRMEEGDPALRETRELIASFNEGGTVG